VKHILNDEGTDHQRSVLCGQHVLGEPLSEEEADSTPLKELCPQCIKKFVYNALMLRRDMILNNGTAEERAANIAASLPGLTLVGGGS